MVLGQEVVLAIISEFMGGSAMVSIIQLFSK